MCSINSSSAVGDDNISTRLIKYYANSFVDKIVQLVNDSMKSGIFPDRLKSARVIPIFKSGSCLDTVNFRPISVLTSMSKIFEKILHNRLSNFFREEKIIVGSMVSPRILLIKVPVLILFLLLIIVLIVGTMYRYS